MGRWRPGIGDRILPSYKPSALLALTAFILLVGILFHFAAKMFPPISGFVTAAYG